jgi:hypothetical protein
MEDWKRIPECPDEGMCLRKVIPKRSFWGTDGSRNVIWKSEQQRSTAVDQGPLHPRIAHSALTTGALNWVRKERRRMVDAFFVRSGPPCAKPT